MKKIKKTRIIALVLFCGMLFLALFAASFFYSLKPITTEQNAYTRQIEIPSGATMKTAAKTLRQNALIRSSLLFYLYARQKQAVLKAGTYRVSSAMSTDSIIHLLASGQSAHIVVSFPEGYTIRKIAELLEKNGICPAQDFIAASYNKALLDEYKIPSDSFQGYLFPDTYFFVPGMNAEAVVRMMTDTFIARLGTIKGALQLSASELYKTIILASIVEREYRVASEAPLIASVFVNRLNQHWGLYSCATIEFIITEIQGNPHPDVITTEDTKIDSPYNTYKWAGLPPGPIASPGLVALNAACHPAKTDYYYFRVADSAVGRHHFSTNFTEHIETGRVYTKQAAGS
jgi:UPF0755 protein